MIIDITGLDNTGKDTQIAKIKSYFKHKHFHTFHYSAVKGLNTEEARMYSEKMYSEMFSLIKYCYSKDVSVILNRDHLGEVVYSPLYRNYSGEYVYAIEDRFKSILDKIYLIVLVDEPKNCLERDDGLSLSTDYDKKVLEKKGFEEAYNNTGIKNKILININNKNIEGVFEEIRRFLEQ